ncbi:MAG: type II toxin-antitoxin system prevent-host-death family antitoxin [Acidimicrobiales bacterium]
MGSESMSRTSLVGVRELRSQVAAVLRRAQRGDRVVVTVDGVPVAQLTPIEPIGAVTLDDLVAGGLVKPPAQPQKPARPERVPLAVDVRVAAVLAEVRG